MPVQNQEHEYGQLTFALMPTYISLACVAGRRRGGKGSKGAREYMHSLTHFARLFFPLSLPFGHLPRRLTSLVKINHDSKEIQIDKNNERPCKICLFLKLFFS